MRTGCLLGVVLLAGAGARGAVLYVDANATGANNGSSWLNAYTDLDDALSAAASGDEVWVADGTYFPPAQATPFYIPGGVAVYGGFAGGEPSLDDRDPQTNLTILDGDFNQDDTPGFLHRSDNAFEVVSIIPSSTDARLDGVVVTGGFGAGAFTINASSTATIAGCLFIDNGASAFGGAVFSSSAAGLTITDTIFTLNATNPNSTGGQGGAIAAIATDMVTVERCAFLLNAAMAQTGALGGAISINSGDARIVDSLFQANTAQSNNTALGGAISFAGGSLDLLRCDFVGNMPDGGTISQGGALYVTGLIDQLTLRAVACSFLGNTATFGSAIAATGSDATLRLASCVVGGNTAAQSASIWSEGDLIVHSSTIALNSNTLQTTGAGIEMVNAAPLTLHNTILWGNDASGLTDEQAQIEATTAPAVNHSCVQGWTGALGGSGNFGADPLFVDPDGQDNVLGTDDDAYYIAFYSPCIDAGDNPALPQDPLDLDDDANTTERLPLDVYLRPRRVDDIDVPDTGAGVAPITDIGAVEFQLRSCPADLAPPFGSLDFSDVIAFLVAFDAMDPGADLAPPAGVFDFSDVIAFLIVFGAGCP